MLMGSTPRLVDGLLAELGRAWEGLDILAEIIAARGGSISDGPVLHRLLSAACHGRPDLCAAVWNVRNLELVPVAYYGCAEVDEAARQLARLCAQDGRTRVSPSAASPDSLPHGGVRVVVARGDAPSGQRAVLAFWSPLEAAPFDSHLTRIAEALVVQMALVLEAEDWKRRLLNEERANAEIQAAREVQSALLESPAAGESDILSWATLSRPARVVGGDFHDVNPLLSGGLDVIVGDVMGKGLSAALLGAACMNHVFRAAARGQGAHAQPGAILTRANRTLGPELMRLETFASVAFARIAGDPLHLTLADAGHANVAVRSRDGSVFEPRGGETFLGVEKGPFRETVIALCPGDLILVFTDGLSDVTRALGETFNVAAWLAAAPDATPAGILRLLAREIERGCPLGTGPEDDITCVAIGVKL